MPESPKAENRRTALWDEHRRAGAKLVPFAGWEMPIQYSSIRDEHRAVRERVGLFDVSHMGEFLITGPDRVRETDRITTAKIEGKEPGFVQYAVFMNESAGIIDDILVYVLEDAVLLVVNAANRAKDFAWVRSVIEGDASVEDISDAMTQIAVQGPRSRDLMTKLFGDSASLPYYRSRMLRHEGEDVIVSRTGYTGEYGYEIYAPWDQGPGIWRSLLREGAEHGVLPIGLGARDSLRMEMGYCLYGNDIDETTNPVEAGLVWVVKPKKSDYIGKEAYLHYKKNGAGRALTGFRLSAREIPRRGYEILHAGEPVGVITSGGFSPSCEVG
ncbi:MAG: glycine cleavage system aminomethyltransferase GcvT, partial [Gemmatimonadetes bacterium]|nr:glycine cleavage system aminomethyltransferase GcvT [Gemmatimonadota bacterium]